MFSNNLEENLEHFSTVISIISKYGLKFKLSKCQLSQRQIGLLCHIADERGVRVDPGKFGATQTIPSPLKVTQVRNFLGVGGYYRRFIKNFARKATALYVITSIRKRSHVIIHMESRFACPSNL